MPSPAAHPFEVEIKVQGEETPWVIFKMPSWTPGRYLVFDYGWQLQDVEAVDEDGDRLPLENPCEDTWSVDRRGQASKVWTNIQTADGVVPEDENLFAREPRR
jgi:predicted metalloprotease with PDZ domain